MATGWDMVKERARQQRLDVLQAEVAAREDKFLVTGGGDYVRDNSGWERWRENPPELNAAAIAEWAYDLLEKQQAFLMEVMEDELTKGRE